MKVKLFMKNASPVTWLSLGYAMIILLSAGILSLPVSSSAGIHTSYLDSLFTATSAITTTGLIVVDTGTYYNLFGQLIILLLIQAGGLGYMLFVILVILALKQKISVQSNLMFQESVKRPLKMDIFHFSKIIILFTVIIEAAGAFMLSLIFYSRSDLNDAIYSGIFHSISAFNTAGFSIYKDSFCAYDGHIALNTTLIVVSILGSLGFFVLFDVTNILSRRIKGAKNRKLSVHSRLVLVCMLAITLVGSILIFIMENWGNDFSLQQKIVSSLFQCSTASTTTGFNSIDISTMHMGNLFLLIVIMFIGAGSGSTGGGIKMTTMAVTILSVLAIVRNRTTVNVFQRRLSFEVIRNSFAIFVLSAAWTAAASYVLLITEKKEFISLLFETTSALATVGLSTGITADLSGMGKMIIIISMFIGRIGPLGIGILLLQRKNVEPDYKYSTTDIFIG